MKILVSHPTSNANFFHLVEGMIQAGICQEIVTTLAFKNRPFFGFLPVRLQKEISRRTFPDSWFSLLKIFPFIEIGRQLSRKLGCDKFCCRAEGIFSVDAVYRSLDSFVAGRLKNLQEKIDAVYSYEDGALKTFACARKMGIATVYDLPIAYWELAQKIYDEEAIRLPQWASTMPGRLDSQKKLARKTRELELADTVVVPSSFVENSLPEWARKRKQIVRSAFGTPLVGLFRERTEFKSFDRPLRILFAGSMTQRKGLADVFAAMKILNRKDIQLVVMGSPVLSSEFYRKEYPDFIYESPRPHAEVLELMQTCDVFVLASLVEGRALVQQEAMACGLPIIITPNTGGEDLVEEGKTGFLVSVRAPEKLAEKISWFADNRRLIPEMGLAAHNKAVKYTWDGYAERILTALKLFRG